MISEVLISELSKEVAEGMAASGGMYFLASLHEVLARKGLRLPPDQRKILIRKITELNPI